MVFTLYERAQEAANFIRSKCRRNPNIAVVLGSGLASFAESLSEAITIDYSEIPYFSSTTIEGHRGKLRIGHCDGVYTVAMQGRFHYYEGYSLEQVTFPIRAFKLLGIDTLVLTNAAGGINPNFNSGTLMLITDHLNLMGENALRGGNDNRFGPRFPDMTEVYTRSYRDVALQVASELAVDLEQGVYAALSGPCYETPAEVRMLRALGADAVGMSTVPEATVARHMDMKVLGISVIVNQGAGMIDKRLSHEEVLKTAEESGARLAELLNRLAPRLAVSNE